MHVLVIRNAAAHRVSEEQGHEGWRQEHLYEYNCIKTISTFVDAAAIAQLAAPSSLFRCLSRFVTSERREIVSASFTSTSFFAPTRSRNPCKNGRIMKWNDSCCDSCRSQCGSNDGSRAS